MKKFLLLQAACLLFLLCTQLRVNGQGTPEVLYYKFNGSGTSVPNLASSPPSGTTTATIQGGQSQGGTSGVCGSTSLIGTGVTSTSDYLNTGWVTSLTGSWTISFYTNNIPSTTTTYYIFGDLSASSFRCFTGGVAGAGNWILRGPLTDVTLTGGASTSGAVSTFVYDSTAGKIYAYLNGALINTVNQSAITLSGTGPFKVGGYSSSNSLPSGSYMDEFRFYRKALSASEVARLIYSGSSSSKVNAKLCGGNYVTPSGKVLNSSGTFYDTLPNYYNCDSVIEINLTVGSNSSSTISPIACNSYKSPSGNYTWTVTGTYKDTLPNASGCDSIVTVNLTVNKSSNATINVTQCDTYTSPSSKYTWTSSGTYKDTITNNAGCDSVITIVLVINKRTTSTIAPVACNSYASPGGQVLTASGTYMDTIPNGAGCDSVITINLTVNYSTTETLNPIACDSYTSPGGKVWTTSGTYMDTIPNSMGCDSIITINLTVNYSTTETLNPVACDSYTSPGGKVWTTSGTYMDTIPNSMGCDSIITINLTVNYSTTETLNPVACNSYTSPGGQVLTASGTYTDTIPNGMGCDSIITINLTVNNSSVSTITPTVCNSYTSPSGRYTYTASGNYVDTIPNGVGCDSIIIINVTVNSANVAVSQSSFTLTAAATGAAYRWLDCANNYTPIAGETSQTFIVTANGDYAVEVTQNNCTDTSVCISITNVGIAKTVFNNAVAIYPNPSNGVVMLSFANPLENATIRIVNITGQTITEKTDLTGKQVPFDISGETAGIYFVEVTENGNTARVKMVKF